MFKIKTVKKYTFRVEQFSMDGHNQIREFVGSSPTGLERISLQASLRKIKLWEMFQNPLWFVTHPDQLFTAQITSYFKIPITLWIMPNMPD